jgi:hypothetical protein
MVALGEMAGMRRIVVLALLSLAAAAPPARADETLAELARPTPVDAWNGRIVYEQDGAVMTRVGDGAPERLPVRPGGRIDLGPGPRGAMVAAYARGGDLFTYDFGDGRERRLSRTAARERLPSVWKGRVAFVRARRLWVRPIGGGAAREVRGGRGDYTSLDLHGRRVAFARVRFPGDRTEWQMLTQGGRGVARLIDRAASGLLSRVEMLRPTIQGGGISYAVARRGAAGQRFLRYDLATRRLREAVSRNGILSAAYDRGRFLYVQTGSDEDGAGRCSAPDGTPGPCLLRRSDPIAFR